MGAFNYVLVEEKCPHCGLSSTLCCQMHVGSDYGGDDTGRFHDREYRMGQRLAWYSPDQNQYDKWRGHCNVSKNPDTAIEASYAICKQCDKGFFVVIEFIALIPMRVILVCSEDDLPAEYDS